MLFVRGIMGNLKLNPAIKIWGGFTLLIVFIVGGLAMHFFDFEDAVEECERRGGTWIGGAVPGRFGMLRSVSGYCADGLEDKEKW